MSYYKHLPVLALGVAAASGCGRLVWTNEAPEIRNVEFALDRDRGLSWRIDVDVVDDDDWEWLTVDVEIRDSRGDLVGGPTLIDLGGGGDNSYHFSEPIEQVPELDPLQPYDLTVTVTDFSGASDVASAHYEPEDLNPPEILSAAAGCVDSPDGPVFVALADVDDADGLGDLVEVGMAVTRQGSTSELAAFGLYYDSDTGFFEYESFPEDLPAGIECGTSLDLRVWAVDELGLYAELWAEGGQG